jgi:hypothetical protein
MRPIARSLTALLALLGGLVLATASAHAHPAPVDEPGAAPALLAPLPAPPVDSSWVLAASGWVTIALGVAVVVLSAVVAALLLGRRQRGVAPLHA